MVISLPFFCSLLVVFFGLALAISSLMYLTSSSALSLGKIGFGFSITLVSQAKSPNDKPLGSSSSQFKPSCSNILGAVSVITGSIIIAIKRRLSAKLDITCESSSFLPSLLRTQGVVSSMYLLARAISFQILSKACEKWSESMYSLYSSITLAAVSCNSLPNLS